MRLGSARFAGAQTMRQSPILAIFGSRFKLQRLWILYAVFPSTLLNRETEFENLPVCAGALHIWRFPMLRFGP